MAIKMIGTKATVVAEVDKTRIRYRAKKELEIKAKY